MHKKIILAISIILVIILIKYAPLIKDVSGVAIGFIFNKNIELRHSDDTINILVLGIGGGTHEGPNLTDTIIFSSINLNTSKVSLVSIPRDLWIPDLREKINTAYAIGEGKKKGGGIILAKAVVSKILKTPVDYGVVINFDGFVKAVDLVGGLSINVDNVLDDYEYPIAGKEQDVCGHTEEEITILATSSSQLEAFPCRYTHLHFDKGIQVMNGEQALAFVRSRHADGDEGTDFSRSKRQEKVISAFREKAFSLGTLSNPVKLISLYNAFSQSVNTDITKDELDDFGRLIQKIKGAKIQTTVLDYGDDATGRIGILIHPDISITYDNQWVLIPRTGNGNFTEIQDYINCFLIKGDCLIR